MIKAISLFGRKRTSELKGGNEQVAEAKKDELLALKLQEINRAAEVSGTLQSLPLSKVVADPNQPRKVFRNIENLANSIRVQGIIQPIIVTPKLADGCYRIIAGERRFLAAQQAGLAVIPCIIRQADDANVVILQLLENDQREAVSPLEEAEALAKLINTMGVNKTQVAKELGRDAAWISIRVGLQQASPAVKALVTDGLVEDVRTLHELRMFEQEYPQQAKQLISKIRNNQLAGSYRQVISDFRSKNKTKKVTKPTAVRTIQKIEKVGDQLLVHVAGNKHPLQFNVTSTVLAQFVATMK